jgi:Flp pilus assembly protein TadD
MKPLAGEHTMKTRRLQFLLLLCLAQLISSCTVNIVNIDFLEDPGLESTILDQDGDLFAQVNPIALNDEIRNFLDSNISSNLSPAAKVGKVRELMFDPQYLNIQYSTDKTYTAAEVFENRSGNCLSVINFYIGVTRYLGLDASFQTVKVSPIWDSRGGLNVLYEHINAIGTVRGGMQYIMDFTPEIALLDYTAETISDEEARALYFSNLGAELMIEGELELALPYLQNALWIDPSLSLAWNNIGVVYHRLGQIELAEYSYKKGYLVNTDNSTVISNLSNLYKATGDTEKAQYYQTAVQQFQNRNPYYHFNLGNEAYQANQFQTAERHYLRAIRRNDNEPEFYLRLASTYQQLGENSRALRMMDRAQLLAQSDPNANRSAADNLRLVDRNSLSTVGGQPGRTISNGTIDDILNVFN